MKSPRLSPDHADHILELEEEMERHLVALMDRATDLGWHQEDVAAAVMSLARNYVLRLEANVETDIAIAKAMIGGERLH
jgi:hypothetical protein